MGSSGADRRSSVRHVATFRIRLGYSDLGAFLDGFAVNISKGGIYVPTKQPKDRGTEVRFEILLKDGTVAVSGVGKVAWARKFDPENPGTRYGMGVQFVKLEGASDSIVRQALDWRTRHLGGEDRPDDVPPDDGAAGDSAAPDAAAVPEIPAASPETAPERVAPADPAEDPAAADPAPAGQERQAGLAAPHRILGDRRVSLGTVDDLLASIRATPAQADRISAPPPPPDDWSDMNGVSAAVAAPALQAAEPAVPEESAASDAAEAAALASLAGAVADPPAAPVEEPPPPPSGPALPDFLRDSAERPGLDALPPSRLLDLLPPQGPIAVPIEPSEPSAPDPIFPAPGAPDVSAAGPVGLDLPSWDEEETADTALAQEVAAAAGRVAGPIMVAGDDDLDIDSLPTSLSSDSSPPAQSVPPSPDESSIPPESKAPDSPAPEESVATEGRKSGFFGRLFGRKK
jgi:uncharacterized protein (TIGR02266 family)